MKAELPQNFIERMKEQLGEEFSQFIASYELEPVRGLRVNTGKISVDDFLHLSKNALKPSEIIKEGFLLGNDVKVKDDPYHSAGLYYMQEPSAMSVIEAARAKPGMNVLDLCAAPGGKSGGVAARMLGQGLLIANEIVFERAKILKNNIERLGITNAVVVNAHPDKLCEALEGYFDLVLVDAPCSGEGMFRRDASVLQEWSREHVQACALRQRAILSSARKAVKDGGALIYSTCTFSPEENEQIVEWFLDENKNFELESMKRLYPHKCSGEGHFIARLIRGSGSAPIKKFEPLGLSACRNKDYKTFIDKTLKKMPNGDAYMLPDGRVILQSALPPSVLSKFRMLSSGVFMGELLTGRFEPSHSMFLASHGGEYCVTIGFSADDERLREFMKGAVLECDANIKGYCAVAVDGYNIGFGKASLGILKNRIPKGLRL